jgi:signal recognition particle receptor subunit beta/GAF domain-containing protein
VAQWNHQDKTLYAKLVYYGPAYGGKTTNLEAIHKITRHDSNASLLSVQTAQERTLFFDLLPFDLGHILGYKVALKLYTVPGQVQYNATRRVVLRGADAVVFVADSTRTRVQHNRDSLKDLAANMQSNKLNPAHVPVLIQYNKQDVQDALTPEEMEQTYGVRPRKAFPAVAVQGEGVMETFLAATKVMLRRLVEQADGKTLEAIDTASLAAEVEKAFEPYLHRAATMESLPSVPGAAADGTADAVVVSDGDLMQRAVEAGLTLGEELATERQRSSRLERESRTYRQLGEALRQTGATFDHRGIIDRTLSMASEVVGAAVISLVRGENPGGRAVTVHRVWGSADDPLSVTIPGRHLLARFVAGRAPTVLNDLASGEGYEVPDDVRERYHAIAGFPVDITRGTTLVAYAPGPDGRFAEDDVRFLSTAAAHLAVSLEKARLYQHLSTNRDRLEAQVQERTEELRLAYEEIRSREQMKDRFLSNLSHEMRTPLTTVTGAATFLRDYESSTEARKGGSGWNS